MPAAETRLPTFFPVPDNVGLELGGVFRELRIRGSAHSRDVSSFAIGMNVEESGYHILCNEVARASDEVIQNGCISLLPGSATALFSLSDATLTDLDVAVGLMGLFVKNRRFYLAAKALVFSLSSPAHREANMIAVEVLSATASYDISLGSVVALPIGGMLSFGGGTQRAQNTGDFASVTTKPENEALLRLGASTGVKVMDRFAFNAFGQVTALFVPGRCHDAGCLPRQDPVDFTSLFRTQIGISLTYIFRRNVALHLTADVSRTSAERTVDHVTHVTKETSSLDQRVSLMADFQL
jgi:hypothetical protein